MRKKYHNRLFILFKRTLICFFFFLIFYTNTYSYSENNSSKLDTVRLQLSYFHQFQFAGYYAAQKKGFYKKAGLYVKLLEHKDEENTVLSLLSSRAEFSVGPSSFINSRLNSAPIILLKAIYQHFPYVIITLKKNNIRTPSDLIGKKLMVDKKINPQIYFMFKNEGIDYRKVIFVKHSYNYDDLIDGKVDAASGFITVQPYYIKSKGYEPYCIKPSDYGVDFYGDMLFTTEKQVEKHPERVKKFVDASIKGWEYAYKHVDEIVDYILTLKSKRPYKLSKDMLLNEAKISRKYVLPDVIEIGHINPQRIRNIAKIFKEMGLAKKDAKLGNFIYNPNKEEKFYYTKKFILFIVFFTLYLFVLTIIIFKRLSSRKEEALKLQQATMDAILSVSPDVYFRVHKNGTILDLLLPQNNIFDIDEKTIIGEKIHEVLPHEISFKIYSLINKAIENSQIQYYTDSITYKNSRLYFESRIISRGNNEVIVFVRDITDEQNNKYRLIASEKKYRALFNFADDAILILKNEIVIDCNLKALEIFACTKEQIVNHSPIDFSPRYQYDNTLSKDKAEEKITLCLAGKPQIFKWKHKRFNGIEFDAEVKLTKLVYENSTSIIAIVKDISEIEQKNKALEEIEKKFYNIFHHNPNPILLIDLETNTIIDCNKSALNVFGFTGDEVIGKNILELYIWYKFDDRDKFFAPIYKNKSVANEYFRFKDKEGKIIHTIVSAEVITINNKEVILGTYKVINELLEKENILKEFQLKFAKIFNLSPVSIAITSFDNGKMIDINNYGLNLLKLEKKDVIGKTSVELNIWQNEKEREKYIQALKKNGYVKNLETTIKNSEGEKIPCSISSEIIDLDNKKFIIGILWDLSDIKEKENKLKNALEEIRELQSKLKKENIVLKEEINTNHNIGNIITNNKDVKKELRKIQQVATTNTTVLIVGETGTGKELFAHAVHQLSNLSDKPLIKINCAALPPNLIESELFGHEKGAFTGAIKQKIGKFELAKNSTIFLDEIGELPLEVQAKLLRVLQEGEFERIGSNTVIKTNARVIAATNRDLPQMIKEKTFRDDLYYRLNVFPIKTIPLRKRKDDIELLTNYFIKILSVELGKKIDSISKHSMELLKNYFFPGNIRELRNIIEQAIILSNSSTLEITLPDVNNNYSKLKNLTDQDEKEIILTALRECNWKIEGNYGAAKKLNLAPSTLRDKIKKYNIKRMP